MYILWRILSLVADVQYCPILEYGSMLDIIMELHQFWASGLVGIINTDRNSKHCFFYWVREVI